MVVEVGSKLEGKVTGITHFGAFVELPGGVTGLVHISEIADTYVKDINEHLQVGDIVTVKIMNIQQDGKIGLSIKKAVDQPPKPPRHMRERGDGFEEKLSRFLKESEDRQSSLRKNYDKRGRGR
ncbi:MAG: S1 RNA-binding domain-containing protein [Brevibacillus sp.]|nr:S1 RNA-binding domain-containing protein [Brevibacillus sp.]